MSKRSKRAPKKLESIDPPFQSEWPKLEVRKSTVPPVCSEAVQTPTGMELVFDGWDDEPTRIFAVDPVILEQCKNPHTRETVRSMQAAVPPSRERPIQVTDAPRIPKAPPLPFIDLTEDDLEEWSEAV